ncbi:hypothetical protein FIB49_04610 [Lactococcus cremoris]|uniref:Uncharacterized protein n=1 Tax=Lactococcus lactis subsp. cremoris TaxID=1359 RepID=A0AA34XK07_LACLC|nr:hypothetical protein [Lactococcus cremoris]ARE22329.1 hypothetical protein LLJM3_0106 [Lactococcus cremoris]KZK50574.1 hypothetical protein SK110_0002 [Lactococcus cremoris]MCT4421270.1 hypothetical protein [Lactococcus cremoris]MCT4426756.1 hypothetical protein [Lactococcus cremoris]MDM7653237.1 hypothetical protein [Lactococcus cremoris]
MKKDDFIVPVNDNLVSDRFKMMRDGWLKWKKEELTQKYEQEQREQIAKLKAGDYELDESEKKFPNIREQVNIEVEGLEQRLLRKYNVPQTNLTKFTNGSNPITKNLLSFASEVYGKSEQWFLYGDLKDYIYTLFNPDRKIMRVSKADAEKLAVVAEVKGLTYGNDQKLVNLAQEVLEFPKIEQNTDLIKLKDEMPDVLKLYKLLSLRAPETVLNTKSAWWALNMENKYRNETDKKSLMDAYFEELEDYRILPSQFRTFPMMIIIRPELTKKDIEIAEKIRKTGTDVGHTENETRTYLENLRKNLKQELIHQKDVIDMYNEYPSKTGKPLGDWIFERLTVNANSFQVGDGISTQILENVSFVEIIWLRKENRRLVLPEKEKQKIKQ